MHREGVSLYLGLCVCVLGGEGGGVMKGESCPVLEQGKRDKTEQSIREQNRRKRTAEQKKQQKRQNRQSR